MTNTTHTLRVNTETHGMVTMTFVTDFNPETDVSINGVEIVGVGRILPGQFTLTDGRGTVLDIETELPYYRQLASDEIYNKIIGIRAMLLEQLSNP